MSLEGDEKAFNNNGGMLTGNGGGGGVDVEECCVGVTGRGESVKGEGVAEEIGIIRASYT